VTNPLQPQAIPGNATAPTLTPTQAYPPVADVIKVCPDADSNAVKKYLPFILKAMAAEGLTSKNQLVGIIATIYVETTSFRPIDEKGNPDRYRGRGWIQLTFSYNYGSFGKILKVDLLNNPDLANQPEIAAKILVAYWKGKHNANQNCSISAEQGNWPEVRRQVNGSSTGYQNDYGKVFKPCVDRGLKIFTQGIDPNAVGALPVDGSYGLGCADPGVGGSRTISQINPQNQGDALAHALGLTNQLLGKAIEFRATLDATADPVVLDLDAQKTFEGKGFGKGLDGTFTVEDVLFHFPAGDRLEVQVNAYQADPNAPQPQVFRHDTTQDNVPATPSSSPVSASGWRWPMPADKVNVAGPKCEFGYARGRLHAGIDLGGHGPDEVFAAANGTVDFTCDIGGAGGYGRMIDVKHPDGWLTRYAHLAKVLVKKGQNVAAGQQIGVRGGSGGGSDSDYPIHLHTELHDTSGKPVNPRDHYPKPGPPQV
jgi:murein DD-endopeptidase MepM/ murein hydrolase activator NlpD